MGVTADMDNKEFYQFAKDTIKPRLSKIKGVGQLVLIGGEEREIKVNLNIDKLNSNKISILQVLAVIKSSNLDFPAGKIKDVDGQYIVRIAGKFTSLEDLKNLVIAKSENSGFVKLKDVAEIEDGVKESTTISRINGRSALGILLQKQSGSNAVEVSDLVKKELKKIEKDYKAKKVVFDVAQDSSVFTIESAKAVRDDLLLAIRFCRACNARLSSQHKEFNHHHGCDPVFAYYGVHRIVCIELYSEFNDASGALSYHRYSCRRLYRRS